jgi:NAD(P)-dependent dehydrogenase (short-subunit alcohol dehydrogenase family)
MKTAVITGASYGIGQAIAEALLQAGWKVYGLSRSKPTFKNENFVWLQCDLSQHDQIAKSLQPISEPTIDVLVSNAGVIQAESASEVSLESYEKTFSVNVLAPMLLVNALLGKIQKATIMSVSSVSDRIPEPDIALYCSSKAANTSYFDSLAQELKDAKVFTLLPDYVDTPMQHNSNDDNKDFDWSACIDMKDLAAFAADLIEGKVQVESGANIIIVTEKLTEDLKSVEKLYGFNTDTKQLTRL